MNILVRAAILLIGSVVSGGCAAIIPHTLMTPTVRQQGEAEVDASTGLHGTSLQAAYAPTNRTVLLASGHRWALGGRWSWAGEAGAGRQWVKPNGGSWGLYAGGGYGTGYSYGSSFCLDLCDDAPSGERVRYVYGFVQPTYTLLQRYTNIGFAVRLQPLRLSRWETYGFRYVIDSLGYGSTEYYPVNRAGRWVMLVQPGMNVRRQISRRFCLTSNISAYFPVNSRKRSRPTILGLATGFGVQLVLGRKAPATPAW